MSVSEREKVNPKWQVRIMGIAHERIKNKYEVIY